MANEYEIKRLLREAAEKLLERRLREEEVTRLYQRYERAYGTAYERAIEALTITCSFSSREISEKRASSDDLDRVMQDLKRETEKR